MSHIKIIDTIDDYRGGNFYSDDAKRISASLFVLDQHLAEANKILSRLPMCIRKQLPVTSQTINDSRAVVDQTHAKLWQIAFDNLNNLQDYAKKTD